MVLSQYANVLREGGDDRDQANNQRDIKTETNLP